MILRLNFRNMIYIIGFSEYILEYWNIQTFALQCVVGLRKAMQDTCGSGTTAYVAEQWGRRWITIWGSDLVVTAIAEG
jgi:hypothetical protein